MGWHFGKPSAIWGTIAIEAFSSHPRPPKGTANCFCWWKQITRFHAVWAGSEGKEKANKNDPSDLLLPLDENLLWFTSVYSTHFWQWFIYVYQPWLFIWGARSYKSLRGSKMLSECNAIYIYMAGARELKCLVQGILHLVQWWESGSNLPRSISVDMSLYKGGLFLCLMSARFTREFWWSTNNYRPTNFEEYGRFTEAIYNSLWVYGLSI